MKKLAIDLVLIYKADFFASLHTKPNERQIYVAQDKITEKRAQGMVKDN